MSQNVIIQNLVKIDGLIIVCAMVNVFFLVRAYFSTTQLYNLFNQVHSMGIAEKEEIRWENKLNQEIHNLYQLSTHQTHLFEQFTSLFPLLGLLGTVISLLSLINFDTELVTINFSAALTSTFWGLLFSIIFKLLYATFLSSKIELNKEVHNTMFAELREEIKQKSGAIPSSKAGEHHEEN